MEEYSREQEKKRTEYPMNKFIFTNIAYVYNTIYLIVYLGKKPLIWGEKERNDRDGEAKKRDY